MGTVHHITPRGAYPANRAAALSGVPISTVHYWARKEILVPSLSASKVKLWSYTDLMGLRTIYWLRQPKHAGDGARIPRSTMPKVRHALEQLQDLDLELWTEERGPAVLIDRRGNVVVAAEPTAETSSQQRIVNLKANELDLVAPFGSLEGSRGPHLHVPRPALRIVPGKLGGSPHVHETRLETQAVAALAESGLPEPKIYDLYPDVDREAIDQSLDLERQLARNLTAVAA